MGKSAATASQATSASEARARTSHRVLLAPTPILAPLAAQRALLGTPAMTPNSRPLPVQRASTQKLGRALALRVMLSVPCVVREA